MAETKFDAKTLAAMAVMGALTTIATSSITIPFPATGGYFNLGYTIVVTTSLLFGPIVGAIAGGIGSGLADYMGGWMAFIIPTTIIKGLEGFVVGYLAGAKEGRTLTRLIVAWLAGAVVLVGGYFIAEAYFLGFGVPGAAAEIWINIPQALASAVGIPIYLAVKDQINL